MLVLTLSIVVVVEEVTDTFPMSQREDMLRRVECTEMR